MKAARVSLAAAEAERDAAIGRNEWLEGQLSAAHAEVEALSASLGATKESEAALAAGSLAAEVRIAALERELAEQTERRGALVSVLDDEKALRAAVAKDQADVEIALTRARTEVEAERETVAVLRAELGTLRTSLAQARRELDQARKGRDRLDRALADREGALDALLEASRSRVQRTVLGCVWWGVGCGVCVWESVWSDCPFFVAFFFFFDLV